LRNTVKELADIALVRLGVRDKNINKPLLQSQQPAKIDSSAPGLIPTSMALPNGRVAVAEGQTTFVATMPANAVVAMATALVGAAVPATMLATTVVDAPVPVTATAFAPVATTMATATAYTIPLVTTRAVLPGAAAADPKADAIETSRPTDARGGRRVHVH
jgi:hypothetical protein